MDNLISAVMYTILIGVVAFYYWMQGHKKGVTETLSVFNEHEPAALKRVQTKLREILGASTES